MHGKYFERKRSWPTKDTSPTYAWRNTESPRINSRSLSQVSKLRLSQRQSTENTALFCVTFFTSSLRHQIEIKGYDQDMLACVTHSNTEGFANLLHIRKKKMDIFPKTRQILAGKGMIKVSGSNVGRTDRMCRDRKAKLSRLQTFHNHFTFYARKKQSVHTGTGNWYPSFTREVLSQFFTTAIPFFNMSSVRAYLKTCEPLNRGIW